MHYDQIIIILLVLTLVFGWVLRGVIFGKLGFGIFMIWNILLALIPVGLVMVISTNFSGDYGNLLTPGGVTLTLLWLLFLPNSYYLLTDLMHLNQHVLVNKKDNKFTPSLHYGRGDPLFIFDSMLLFLTAVLGAAAGGFCLEIMYGILEIEVPTLAKPIIVLFILLVAIGVYIGRFGRWNSWDAILKPQDVIKYFLVELKNKQTRNKILLVTLTLIIFQVVSWVIIKLY